MVVQSALCDEPIIRGWYDPEAASSNFINAVCSYKNTGNCASGIVAFAKIANKYPLDYYTADSKDISQQLKILEEENNTWTEPFNWKNLSLPEQIDYHIYHLRDLNFIQSAWPDECNVMYDSYISWYTNQSSRTFHPGLELKRIGISAVPSLISLLNDRRPIRSIGFHRPWHRHGWSLLRYQDGAIQILEEIAGQKELFYRRTSTSSYLSTESQEYRDEVISEVKTWYKKKKDAEQGRSTIPRGALRLFPLWSGDLIVPVKNNSHGFAGTDGRKD